MNVMEYIKEWEIYAGDKKVYINEEHVSKLKYILKSEIDQKISKLENGNRMISIIKLLDSANPFQDLDPVAQKYFLEIIHPFNISYYQQMKIQI